MVQNRYKKIVSTKKTIKPVKATRIPKNRGTKDRKTLTIDRKVPTIKQNIAKMVLKVSSLPPELSLTVYQHVAQHFLYIKQLTVDLECRFCTAE